MKRAFVLLAVILVLAVPALAINLPSSGITGFFVQVGITGFALAKEILKTVLTFVLKLLG